MICDNLIETIISRAYEKIESNDYIGAAKVFSRAWKRVCDYIKNDNISSIEEYEQKYESTESVLKWFIIYLDVLQCCFEETGDIKYLEESINLKENYSEFFISNMYSYCQILLYASESKFNLGKKEEAIKELKELLEKYDTFEEIYYKISELYIKVDRLKEAKKILNNGICKCEFNTYLREKLDLIELDK